MLRTTLIRIGGGSMVWLVGAIAAILAGAEQREAGWMTCPRTRWTIRASY